MGGEDAIERVAVLPIKAARRLRVRPVNWELGELVKLVKRRVAGKSLYDQPRRVSGARLGDPKMRMALIRASWLGALLLAAAMAQAAQGGGRVLTTSDVVAIRIPDHPDLDWTARIEPDGTINFPYVGRIKAAGLTEEDLARTVERRLVELKIIVEP